MKKYHIITILGISLAILDSGCRSMADKTNNMQHQAISKSEENKMNMIAEHYGNDILRAIQTENYQLFIKHFIPETQKKISQKSFKQRITKLKSKVGNLTSKKFLTVLDQDIFRTYVWKTEFIRQTSKGQVKIQEIFRLMLVKMDGQYYVISFYLY